MNYTKKDLKRHISTSKKTIRLLKKLQKLCWSTIEAGTHVFIEREERNLALYQKNLRNGEYADAKTSKCECGAELDYIITPFMTNEKRVCRKCKRIHYVDTTPIDWNVICNSNNKENSSNEK